MRFTIGAIARYFTGRPLLVAFTAVGAADSASSAALALISYA